MYEIQVSILMYFLDFMALNMAFLDIRPSIACFNPVSFCVDFPLLTIQPMIFCYSPLMFSVAPSVFSICPIFFSYAPAWYSVVPEFGVFSPIFFSLTPERGIRCVQQGCESIETSSSVIFLLIVKVKLMSMKHTIKNSNFMSMTIAMTILIISFMAQCIQAKMKIQSQKHICGVFQNFRDSI
jgi:hypothetical protein